MLNSSDSSVSYPSELDSSELGSSELSCPVMLSFDHSLV